MDQGDNIPYWRVERRCLRLLYTDPCHPSCSFTLRTHLALGQVMTRMRLNDLATPVATVRGLSPFTIMVILTLFYLVVYVLVTVTQSAQGSTVKIPPIPDWLPFFNTFEVWTGLNIALYALGRIRTRAYIQKQICNPQRYSPGCDDCCM
jgi:hypothetical protein